MGYSSNLVQQAGQQMKTQRTRAHARTPYLCRCRTRPRNRPHPCRTRRITPVRTSPRACRTPCGSSAPLCRRRRPGNSRSHPARSVCSAASRRTAPRCICRGSWRRTWRWRPTPPRPAAGARRAPWRRAETSLDAGFSAGGRREEVQGAEGSWQGCARGDLSRVPCGSSGWMVISDGQLCFAHDLPSSISSFRCYPPPPPFFGQSVPVFRDPALLRTAIHVTWCHKLYLVCLFFRCVWPHYHQLHPFGVVTLLFTDLCIVRMISHRNILSTHTTLPIDGWIYSNLISPVVGKKS